MYWGSIVLIAAVVALASGLAMVPLLKASTRRDRRILAAVVLLVPLAGLIVYHQRGSLDEVELARLLHASGGSSPEARLDELESALERQTVADPKKAEYWFLLAELRRGKQNHSGALEAYARALELRPEDTRLQSRLAEAQFLVDGHRLTEQVRQYIDLVLATDPGEPGVLSILGASAFGVERYSEAMDFWNRALLRLPAQSAQAMSLRSSIERAAELSGVSGDPSASFIDVHVSLAEHLQPAPETPVYVFAREYQGAPMPVAVLRKQAGELPMRLRLSDSDVMTGSHSLADYKELELVARLSVSGQPVAQPGDFQVVVGPVHPVSGSAGESNENPTPVQLIISEPADSPL